MCVDWVNFKLLTKLVGFGYYDQVVIKLWIGSGSSKCGVVSINNAKPAVGGTTAKNCLINLSTRPQTQRGQRMTMMMMIIIITNQSCPWSTWPTWLWYMRIVWFNYENNQICGFAELNGTYAVKRDDKIVMQNYYQYSLWKLSINCETITSWRKFATHLNFCWSIFYCTYRATIN